MVRRRKRKKQNKALKALHPSTFFVKRGRLRFWRTLVVVVLILFFSWNVTDLKQIKIADPDVENVTKLPMNKLTRDQFIRRLAPEAQMLQVKYGVRASISLSQAALESNWGDSRLAYEYNNFFGVKATAGAQSVTLPTSEYIDKKWIKVDAQFRVYDSWQESMEAHAQLLVNGTSDNPRRYQAVITANDAQASARALVTGGYATDPQYAEKIIRIIDVYNLTQYDYD
ncbi:MAG: glycoside hydrolase family 73 protein [Lactobacillaceae bacterium]|nr:glycoside hydrolase family 73 protein [Lactobacillaceae bacterium]